MSAKTAIKTVPANEHSTLGMYLSGFILSVVLTLTAYFAVTQHLFAHRWLVGIIIGLALLQFIVQLLFFLHLGPGRQRWRMATFLFMIGVICILVFGSLWIMNNLNYRMTPQQVNTYLNSQDGF